ncbi:MAG: hypothetical protein ACE5F4_00460 [Candidatus Paceibacteria bacterium]
MKYATRFLALIASFGKPHPTRDWYVVLALSALVVIWTVLIASYLFFGLRSGDIISPGAAGTDPAPSVSRETIERVTALYETRALNYEEGNIRLPQTPDPSR